MGRQQQMGYGQQPMYIKQNRPGGGAAGAAGGGLLGKSSRTSPRHVS